jgi:hypothetical protein
MSTWNYRVIAHKNNSYEDEVFFEVHEVHYDDKGTPKNYSEHGCPIGGESYEEMQWQLHKMFLCLSKPVLDASDWPNIKVHFDKSDNT